MNVGFFPSSKIQKEAPAGLVPRCGSCGLLKTCNSPKMPVYGDGRLKVMVVGEAPGETEDNQNRPFVGKAGQLLRQKLGEIGVQLDKDCWTTNALICRPPNNVIKDIKQVSYCRPNLLNAIKLYKPKVIVTLGRSALLSVLEPYWKDVGPMERWQGFRIPLTDYWLCPTYHPSFLLRSNNPMLERLFSDHLEAAFAIEEPLPKQPAWEGQIKLLWSFKEVWEALRYFHIKGGWVSVDYETNCLKPEWPKAEVYSIAISNGQRTVSFLWTKSNAAIVGEFLQQGHIKFIAANLKMEERWTRKLFGHGVANWQWDTMLAAHCLDNRKGICSLKFQLFVKLGVPVYNENVEPYLKSDNGPYNRINLIEPKTLLTYGGIDALGEYKLAMLQRKEMGYVD